MSGGKTDRYRQGAAEWIVAGFIIANLGWTTLCLGGYRPETMIVSSALTTMVLFLWLLTAGAAETGVRLHFTALAMLPFLIYAAINAAWVSPVSWLGWWDWLGWGQMAATYWVVAHGIKSAKARWMLFGGMIALGVVAVALAFYQRSVDPGWLMMGRRQSPQFIGRCSGPFGIPNSLAALMNLLLPGLLAMTLQRGAGAVQRVLCGYLAALFALGALLTVSRGAWLALGAVLVAWPLLSLRGAPWRRVFWSAAVAAALLLLAAGLYRQVPGTRDRIDVLLRQRSEISRVILWQAGWALFRENPLLGAGAGSYNVVFERHRPARFWDAPRWAHNDYLNTLSDYGALGFALSFVVAAVMAWPMRKLFRAERDGAAGNSRQEARFESLRKGLLLGLMAFALQLFVDFNLKIPALAQAAAIAAGLVVSSLSWGWWSPPLFRSRRAAWWAGGGAALVLVVLYFGWALPAVRAEARRYGARQELDQLQKMAPHAEGVEARWQGVHQRLVRAVDLYPRHGEAWSDLADALIHRARMRPAEKAALGRAAENAAARSLALSRAVPEFWARHGIALDLQGRRDEADADFKRALELAPRRADLWYYHAHHLSFTNREEARRAVAISLELDPWNGPALALQKHLEPATR